MHLQPGQSNIVLSSSSERWLDPSVMNNESLPTASSPKVADNTKVLSRRASPGHGEVREAVKVASEGNTSAAENMGELTPMETGDGGHAQFGPQPNIIPETHMTP